MSIALEELVSQVESSADWRARKAAEYPDDKRNARSSSALTLLAEKLQALPSGDAAVAAFENVMERAHAFDSVIYRVVEMEQPYINRYGFDYPMDGDPVSFLDGLTAEVAELVEAAEEQAAEEESEAKYEAAKETADEAAKEAAHESATKAAEVAAKEAAEKSYKKAYNETYRKVYEETYKETLLEALGD